MTEDLAHVMRTAAEAVGAIVSEVDDLTGALSYAVEITRKQGGSTIAAPGLDAQNTAAFRELCRGAGIELLESRLRDHLSVIRTGFTIADRGIAETGTLVLDSTSEDIRIATTLSEIHIAVLPLSRISPDSSSLEHELSELMKSPPRYLSFISGASRTADIERVLTIGVHGPGELHILILKDTE